MTYIPDFSDGEYYYPLNRCAKTVGWLSGEVEFEKAPPSAEILDRLWDFCAVSIGAMRGYHFCDICNTSEYGFAEKNGLKLILGRAEIRVFSEDGEIYAAPNLIHHYVSEHHYKLPDKFVDALLHGTKPPDPAYFQRLDDMEFEWEITWNEGQSQIPKIIKALREAVEHHLNCKVRPCGSDKIQVDWLDDLIHIDTFELYGHSTHKYAHAWYLKPKGVDSRPYLFFIYGATQWLSIDDEAAIHALIEEYQTLDGNELDLKYGRLSERYYSDGEIMAEYQASKRKWPGVVGE